MTFYAIERSDGGVSILESTPEQYEEAVRKWEESVGRFGTKGGIPAGTTAVSVREIKKEDIPADRTFRKALKPDLTHDMEQCKAMWRDKMREVRAPLLVALDQELSRFYNDPVKQDAIEADRQVLRDVTADPAIDAARTPEDLKTAWPEVLGDIPAVQAVVKAR